MLTLKEQRELQEVSRHFPHEEDATSEIARLQQVCADNGGHFYATGMPGPMLMAAPRYCRYCGFDRMKER